MPTDREQAEAMLRERFPESEGWTYRRVEDYYEGEFHEVTRGRVSVWAPLHNDDGSQSIADWDAATDRQKVRELVRAAQAVAAADDKPAGSTAEVVWLMRPTVEQLRAALAALPAHWMED